MGPGLTASATAGGPPEVGDDQYNLYYRAARIKNARTILNFAVYNGTAGAAVSAEMDYDGNKWSQQTTVFKVEGGYSATMPQDEGNTYLLPPLAPEWRYVRTTGDFQIPETCGYTLRATTSHTAVWQFIYIPSMLDLRGPMAYYSSLASDRQAPACDPPPPPPPCDDPGDGGGGGMDQTAPMRPQLSACPPPDGGGGGGGGGGYYTVEVCHYWAVYINDGTGWYLDHIELDYCETYTVMME